MPLYRVLKTLDIDGKRKEIGERVELDARRGEWLRTQHQAVAPIGSAADMPALMKPRPVVRGRCCGR